MSRPPLYLTPVGEKMLYAKTPEKDYTARKVKPRKYCVQEDPDSEPSF